MTWDGRPGPSPLSCNPRPLNATVMLALDAETVTPFKRPTVQSVSHFLTLLCQIGTSRTARRTSVNERTEHRAGRGRNGFSRTTSTGAQRGGQKECRSLG